MVAVDAIACASPDCERALALLDEEFIYSRGRTLSLSVRFANVLSEAGSRLLVIRNEGPAESALLLRPFEWITPDRVYRAAMIGLVWTHPEARGRGYAGALLAQAAESMRRDGIDFAVLWTTRPGVYGRAGWISADCGAFGRYPCGGGEKKAPAEARALWPAIHALREAQGGERVRRSLASYRTLLPPATEHDAAIEGDAYALIGRAGSAAYIYEIGGSNAALAALWHRLGERYGELLVNVQRASAAHRWLAAIPEMTWKDPSLAMWLPLSRSIDPAFFSRWYIPYVDRI